MFCTGILACNITTSQTQNDCFSKLDHAKKVNDTKYQKQILLYMLILILNLMLKEFKGLLHV